MRANHEENWVPIKTGRGETEVHVKRGQFIFGRKTAAKELGMKPSSIRNRMEKLKNMKNLDIQPDTHYSIVTIINYDTYNPPVKKEDRQEDNQGTGKGQPKDTDNNEENVKKEKKRTLTLEFEQFWAVYPKKVAKQDALKKWLTKKPPLDLVLGALEWQSKQWSELKYIPNPSTYLNQGRWEDEQSKDLARVDQPAPVSKRTESLMGSLENLRKFEGNE